MDSVSQIALGAAVAVAVVGRRSSVGKAALWGAVAGTLPDLDVLLAYGDPIRDMVLHRAETHALFWLSLFSLPLAAAVAWLHKEGPIWRRWWLALWLVLVTHPLLDTMTVYGTQLALPFSDHPFGVGSVFIIDPLYTVPLLVGAGWALASRGSARGLAANVAGLVLSTAYLGWGFAAQQHVQRIARAALAAQGIAVEQLLVTPAPLNTVLWRVVAMSGAHYHEGFYGLLDAAPADGQGRGGPPIHFDRFPSGHGLARPLSEVAGLRRIMAFSKGFYKLHLQGGRVVVTDLRMGQEPHYAFSFAVAERHSPLQPLLPPVQVGSQPDLALALPWLWRRMQGEPLPPPR
jgi:inner membrane protein